MSTSVEPQARSAVDRPITPAWLWVALLAGAAVNVWWALFVGGFLKEPSAVGRVEAVLLTSICLSALSGLAGAGGAVGLLRREPWGRALAWIGAVTLTLSGAGAIGGIPALVGLLWSRKPLTP
jgi:uncharacterized membrane protein YbhN (UPF0104 family)